MHQDVTWCGARPRPRRLCVRWGPRSPFPKRGKPPIFGPCLLWPNDWMDRDGTWHGGRPWFSPHCARWGHSSPPQKGGRAHQFSAHVYCGQTAAWIKMPLGTEVGLGLRDIVFNVDPATQLPPEKGHIQTPTQFLTHVYGQMARWIKTPLGTEVDLDPCHIVLDGVPALAKGAQQPRFWPLSIVATVAHLSYC